MSLSLNDELERSAYDAFQKWERSSKVTGETNKRFNEERLIELQTGQEVDIIADERGIMDRTLDTKLSLPFASLSTVNSVITYNSFIVDVPGDGDCGYHAIRRASLVYGRTTATELPHPKTAWETRQTLLAYLRAERIKIERAAIDHVNETQGDRNAASIVLHLIWRDISCVSVPAKGTQPLFEEYCDALCRGGIGGKWLGSMLGEIELHLLARCLGVKLFCVRASLKDGKPLLRKEGDPFNFLWKGRMSYQPKGAILIRFVGHFGHGHFQIVNCGTMGKKAVTRHGRVKAKSKARRKSPRMREDVHTVKGMYGVLAATKRRYEANLRLVTQAFEELTAEGRDPLKLETNGEAVLDVIMELMMQRCGPKSEDYEGLSANSTGKVLLAAVGVWYKEQGHHFPNQETCVVKEKSVSGPPQKADQIVKFRSLLQKQQAKARSNPIRRANQLTHDDIAEAVRVFVCDQRSCGVWVGLPWSRNGQYKTWGNRISFSYCRYNYWCCVVWNEVKDGVKSNSKDRVSFMERNDGNLRVTCDIDAVGFASRAPSRIYSAGVSSRDASLHEDCEESAPAGSENDLWCVQCRDQTCFQNFGDR